MRVKTANDAIGTLLPSIKRPIGHSFKISSIGGYFELHTIESKRGWGLYPLQDGERPGDYEVFYIYYAPDGGGRRKAIIIHFYFSPSTDTFKIEDWTKKSGRDRPEYEYTKAIAIATILSACVFLPKAEVVTDDTD